MVAQYGITPASISDDVTINYTAFLKITTRHLMAKPFTGVCSKTKVIKGYEDFLDAYNGKVTYYPKSIQPC